MQVKLIIFDMDGLMFDTERHIVDMWGQAGRESGLTIPAALVSSTAGLDAENTRKVFVKQFGGDFPYEKIRARRIALQLEEIEKNGVPIKKGLLELLDYLEEKNIQKAVATSTDRERTTLYLQKAGLLHRFDTIVCGDEVKNGKPAPDIFLKAAEKMDVVPADCLVLEDSPNGILAAHNACMRVIMVPDLAQADETTKCLLFAVCSSLLDVIKML